MSEAESKVLANIIRGTWKDLALADQSDADQLLEILKTALENLEQLEASK